MQVKRDKERATKNFVGHEIPNKYIFSKTLCRFWTGQIYKITCISFCKGQVDVRGETYISLLSLICCIPLCSLRNCFQFECAMFKNTRKEQNYPKGSPSIDCSSLCPLFAKAYLLFAQSSSSSRCPPGWSRGRHPSSPWEMYEVKLFKSTVEILSGSGFSYQSVISRFPNISLLFAEICWRHFFKYGRAQIENSEWWLVWAPVGSKASFPHDLLNISAF